MPALESQKELHEFGGRAGFGRRFKPASINRLRATDRLTFASTDQASTASDNEAGRRTAVNTEPPAIAGRPTFLN
jgi:hypothetical protein